MSDRGITLWFTGMSGAGKTTIAVEVEKRLRQRGVRVERLDGDVVRESLTKDLGFSKEDRDKNIERVSFVAKLLTRQGVIVLASFISPYQAMREYARRQIGEFAEIYVDAPLQVLIDRDVKGLYKKAIAGEIANFTGISDPYEPPEQPDLHLRTDRETVAESAARVIAFLEERGYIPSSSPAGNVSVRSPHGAAVHPFDHSSEFSNSVLPHGGRLVDRELRGEARLEALAHAQSLRRIRLDAVGEADVEMLGVGALSPLEGFLNEADYRSVVAEMHLANGLPWTIPITLAVSEADAADIAAGQTVALEDRAGRIVALLDVEEKYRNNKRWEARNVYGTEDENHPGVARLYARGDVLLGGKIHVVERPGATAFPAYRLTPRETRALFAERGWRTVVAFQTRNPVHRAHEYIQKAALETVDGLLLHPLVGATKSDDIPAAIRMESYEAILRSYYPADRVLLAVFPAAMRYAGPREAVFHAICRKNYGCTHFIVGRDHAGVGNYYGTYDAQKIFDRFDPAAIGIVPLKFEHTFYCKACKNMASAKTCPHEASWHVILSGTKVRAMLREGTLPPEEFTRPEVAHVLIRGMQTQEPERAEREVSL